MAEQPKRIRDDLPAEEDNQEEQTGKIRRTDEVPPLVPPEVEQPNIPPIKTEIITQSSPPMPPTTVPTPITIPPLPPTTETPQSPAGEPQQKVKFENALDFLDQVKFQFATQPKVYNQFLDIMKDFKAQAIDTPGVIARVSELFKGHKNLILGFNTFLPPGYKIEAVPDDGPVQMAPMPIQQAGQLLPPSVAQMASAVPAAGAGQRKQPEVDHARNYVKKIKMRFALHPHTYKAFLDILHTYHKEQHTTTEVYEQVSKLFKQHPDLLEEFSQFLPDPMAAPNQATSQTKPAKKPAPRKPKQEKALPEPKLREAAAPRKKETRESSSKSSNEEVNFFQKVKARVSQQQYYEFLKCINLFSQGITTRMELIILVKDLLAKHAELFDWFKNFIGFDESTMELIENNGTKSAVNSTTGEIDFKQCKRYGPSYRALPKNYTPSICSGRTPLCDEVLNDTWVSVPTGTEDGFINLRKNQYEEMLFKCEDDRFELDLVIEYNSSTIRALEFVQRGIEIGEGDSPRFRLDTNLDPVIHVRSIERIYGEKGSEIIEALYAQPRVTIPVILARLREKDQEWTKARREWNKVWREVNEKNYYKSLDHQSIFFKQTDKKNLAPRVLIAEIKERYQQQLKDRETRKRQKQIPVESKEKSRPEGSKSDSSDSQDSQNSTIAQAAPVKQFQPPHLSYSMGNISICRDIYQLILQACERSYTKAEEEKIETFFRHFMKQFLEFDQWDENSTNSTNPVESIAAPSEAPTAPTAQVEYGKVEVPPILPSKAVPDTGKSGRIFYGDTEFYVFFRLFQILYTRLENALILATSTQESPANFSFIVNPSKKIQDEKDRYSVFVKLLKSLVAGTKEQSVFEEEARSLYGVEAYALFTLDKVTSELTKQLVSILDEEVCSKLLALYSHETSQSNPHDAIYYYHCLETLSETESRILKFEFNRSNDPEAESIFAIWLLDPTSQPPPYLCVDVTDDTRRHDKWSQYAQQYLHSDPTLPPNHRVFLKRNLKRNENRKKEDVKMELGLQGRIRLRDFTLCFVENTSDLLWNSKALPPVMKPSKKRPQSMSQVLDKIMSLKPQQ
eukprot:TRINITY_DN5110_c0_g3_i1.p1 TRINITY_DN5110_c0_g3~~TRINITY_DN5110_c0_g3_i1.p1  ORF type:complete len:1099 (+),score=261.83 TRINITY_DN5110_c0_g3_i1:72-3299(+)